MSKKITLEKLFGKRPKNGYEFTNINVEPYKTNNSSGLAIQWAAKGMGFGEVVFSIDETGIEMSTEFMSDEFVIALLTNALPKIIKLTKRID